MTLGKSLHKKIKTASILVIVLIILGFGFYETFPTKNLSQKQSNQLSDEQSFNEMQQIYIKISNTYKELKQDKNPYRSQNLESFFEIKRDPFETPIKKQKKEQNRAKKKTPTKPKSIKQIPLTLNGILWDEETPSAIINGEVVYVGGKIASYRMLRILPEKVILTSGGKRRVLRLESE